MLLALSSGNAAAQQASEAPTGALGEVRFDQRLGESVPLDTVFRDATGADVTLGSLLTDRPAVLALVYYECPMLCPLIMNGLVKSLKTMNFAPGKEFDVIALSFDPGESPQTASIAKSMYVEHYGRPETGDGWHFLTGTEEAIRSVTDAVGFYYEYDEDQDEYAHAAGIIVLTPDGTIGRYFYGIEYPPRDLRLGLVEAGEGRVGSLVDQVLLYCYRYDPETGQYSAVVMNIVRLGAVVTLVALALFFTAAWRLDRRLATMEKTT
jgi:protein SCO1/2